MRHLVINQEQGARSKEQGARSKEQGINFWAFKLWIFFKRFTEQKFNFFRTAITAFTTYINIQFDASVNIISDDACILASISIGTQQRFELE